MDQEIDNFQKINIDKLRNGNNEENKVLKKIQLRCGNCFTDIGVEDIAGYDFNIEKRSGKYIQFRSNRLEQLFGLKEKIDMKDNVDDADIPQGQSKD